MSEPGKVGNKRVSSNESSKTSAPKTEGDGVGEGRGKGRSVTGRV